MQAQAASHKAVAVAVAPGNLPLPNEFDSGIELEQTAHTPSWGAVQPQPQPQPQMLDAPAMSRPEPAAPSAPAPDGKHWSRKVRLTRLSAAHCARDAITLRGGSDNAEFVLIGDLRSSELRKSALFAPGDVLLKLQTQSLSGFTLRDASDWLKALVEAQTEQIVFETVKSSLLPKKLKQFLRKRFQRGSLDHQLQQTIRNNLYLRTVPCTTRPKREGETDGTHYRFVTTQQFKQLERSGELLEYGMHGGNYYGTPKPPVGATALRLSLSLSNLANRGNASSTPAALAPSAAVAPSAQIERDDRHIQRSLAEAQENPQTQTQHRSRNSVSARSSPLHLRRRAADSVSQRSSSAFDPSRSAAPVSSLLLTNSSSIAAALNNPHTPSMTTSLNESTALDVDADRTLTRSVKDDANAPTLKRNGSTSARQSLANSSRTEALHIVTSDLLETSPNTNSNAAPTDEEDLPYGWECVHDPQYGVYYIDHVQKKTQYEHPSVTLKDQVAVARPPAKQLESPIIPYNAVPPFSHDAGRLPGERISIELVKGIRGFGFSLVGSDRPNDSYLQVKSILRNGPADVDGRLSRGDILVSVNQKSVLGFSYEQVVQLFQSIAVGSRTEMTVSKYYRLPLDETTGTPPRVVRQVAVDPVEPQISATTPIPTVATPVPAATTTAPAEPLTQQQPAPQPVEPTPAHTPAPMLLTDEAQPDAQGLVRIRLRKIEQTFGFTIARNPNGLHVIHNISPRVEQCRALRIGDILFAVDEVNVLQAGHGDIVALFKRVQPSQEVLLTVLRLPNAANDAQSDDATTDSLPAPPPLAQASVELDMVDGQAPEEMLIVPTVHRRAQTPHFVPTGNSLEQHDQPPRPSSVTPFSGTNSHNYTQLVATQPPIAASLLVPATLASPSQSTSLSGTGSSHNANTLNAPFNAALTIPQPASTSAPRSPPAPPVWDSFEVRLRRNDKGFGFRLVGGYEHGQQVAIGYVLPGSPADDAGLRSADQIVAIDHVVILGAAHADAVRLLTQAAHERGECTLRVRRKKDATGSSAVDWNKIERGTAPESGYSSGPASNSNASASFPFAAPSTNHFAPSSQIDSQSSTSTSTQSGAERLNEITLQRAPHETFGFVIVSSTTRTGQYVGEFVGRIVAGSPADRCAQLKVGQRLAAVNGVPVTGLPHEAIVQLIKSSGLVLSLTLLDTATHAPPMLIPLPPAMSTQVGLDALASLTVHDPASFRTEPSKPATPLDGAHSKKPTPPSDSVFEVELVRTPSAGFGFSLRGGREFGQPLAVHKIAEGSCAARDGRLAVGDIILAVNGRPATELTHQQAVELLQKSGVRVLLRLRKASPRSASANANSTVKAQSNPNVSFGANLPSAQASVQLNPGARGGLLAQAPTRFGAPPSTPTWLAGSSGQPANASTKVYNNGPNSFAGGSVTGTVTVRPPQIPNFATNAHPVTPLDVGKSSNATHYAPHSTSYRI